MHTCHGAKLLEGLLAQGADAVQPHGRGAAVPGVPLRLALDGCEVALGQAERTPNDVRLRDQLACVEMGHDVAGCKRGADSIVTRCTSAQVHGRNHARRPGLTGLAGLAGLAFPAFVLPFGFFALGWDCLRRFLAVTPAVRFPQLNTHAPAHGSTLKAHAQTIIVVVVTIGSLDTARVVVVVFLLRIIGFLAQVRVTASLALL